MLALIQKGIVKRGLSVLLALSMVVTFFGGYAPVAQAADLAMVSSGPIALSWLDAGSVVQFAGYQWIVLDPAQGLLLMRGAYGDPRPFDTGVTGSNFTFAPTKSSNVAYLLNNGFLSSLTATEQLQVKTHAWQTGPQGSNSLTSCDAKVGLLSQSQVEQYAAVLQYYPLYIEEEVSDPSPSPSSPPSPSPFSVVSPSPSGVLPSLEWWTSTWHAVGDAAAWTSGVSGNYYIDNNEADGSLVYPNETNSSASHYVRPAIYLDANTQVDMGSVLAPQNDILSLTVDSQVGDTVIYASTKQVKFYVPTSVDVTQIAPMIQFSSNATISPASGVPQDFTNPVQYTVTSPDGFGKIWTVSCEAVNVGTDIVTFVGAGISSVTIDTVKHTVNFVVPSGMSVTALSPTLGLSPGATVGVVSSGGEVFPLPSAEVGQNFTTPVTYRVTATSGGTQDWVVTCAVSGTVVPYHVEHYVQKTNGLGYDLYRNEACGGVVNTTVTAAAMSDLGFIENTAHPDRVPNGTTLADGSLILKLYYTRTKHSVLFDANGGTAVRDILSVRYGTTINDPDIQRVGYNLLGWYTVGTNLNVNFPLNVTENLSLYAKWQKVDGNPGEITGFWVPGQTGVTYSMGMNGGSIDFVMPYGTDYSKMAPIILGSTGTTFSITSGDIQSMVDGGNVVSFNFTVSNGLGDSTEWSAVSVKPQNSVRSFGVMGQLGQSVIDEASRRISFTMPYGTDVTSLQPQITMNAPWSYSPFIYGTLDFSSGFWQFNADNGSFAVPWSVICSVSNITGFSIPGQVGPTVYDGQNRLITVHVPAGTDRTNLTANVQIPAGSTIDPSPASIQDYSGDVYYSVKSGSDAPVEWTVRCVEDFRTGNDITALTVENQIGLSEIDTSNHKVVFTMPYKYDLSALAPVFTPSTGAIAPGSGIVRNFTTKKSYEYVVYAEDNTPQVWTVECKTEVKGEYRTEHYQQNLTGDTYTLLEYVDTATDPGAVTATPKSYTGFTENQLHANRIAAGTVVEGSKLVLKLYYDRNLLGLQYEENGGSSIADLSSVRYGTVISEPDIPNYEGYKFLGWYSDAAFSTLYDFTKPLTKNETLYAKWIAQYTVSYRNPDETVLSAETMDVGTVFSKPSDPFKDEFAFMGWYLEPSLSTLYAFNQPLTANRSLYASFKRSGTDIMTFAVSGQVGASTIDATAHSVVFHLPFGTAVTEIQPQITASLSGSVFPASNAATDFTNPVTYKVTAESGTTQDWIVTCVVDPNPANDITAFTVSNQVGVSTIDTTAHTVVIHMPFGTNVTALQPQISVSANGSVSPASNVATDFTNPVPYTVTSQSHADQTWTVTCVVDPNTANDITAFTVSNQVGSSIINATAHTVVIHMPFGTNVTALQPQITISTNGSVSPVSNVATDFTNPVPYTVTSESHVPQTWTVTCVVDPNTANDIVAFAVPGQVGASTVNTVAHTVVFHMPFGASVSALLPEYTISENATSSPAIVAPISFMAPVQITVTSESGAAQTWTVTCVVDPNAANDITAFSVTGQVGNSVIDSDLHTVAFTVPYGTVLTGLQPSITASVKATVSPASQTAVNFTNPVQYTVTAENQTTQIWTATCTVEKNIENDIVRFTVPGQVGSSEINKDNHTVLFYLYPGTSLTNLAPMITVSGAATVKPQSGITPTFVNGQVAYTVTAESGAAQIWIVSYRIYYIPEPPPKPETPQEKLQDAVSTLKETVPVRTTTGNATSVDVKTAVLVGVIRAGGGEEIQVGFRYRAAEETGWNYTSVQTIALQNGQSFSTEVRGLKANTVYQFEARAVSRFGMSEGGVLSFATPKSKAPQVQTLDSESGKLGVMTVTGLVQDDGGEALKEAGFLWGDSADQLQKISLGAATKLSTELKDLKVGGTYYFRAYATNSSGIGFGELRTFKVPGMIAMTLAATEVTKDGGTLQGKVLGNDKILESGFTISPAVTGTLLAAPDKDGNFKVQLKGLKSGTKYYFTAYVKTAEKEYSGEVLEFIPQTEFPVVETFEARNVTQVMATLSGYTHKNKGFKILDSGIYWGMDPNPDRQVSVSQAEDLRSIEFRLLGLKANTTYYYKAYSKNEKGTGYGEVVSFTTEKATIPVLQTSSARYDRTAKQWVLLGEVQSNGGEALVEYGFRLSSDQKAWTDLPIGFDTLGGYVSRGLPIFRDLKPGAYYVKAYAINSTGTGEGETLTLLVPSLPKVKTSSVQEIDLDKATLTGSIADTGAEGALCYSTQFKIRKAGEKDWQTVGVTDGDFGAIEFRFEVTGLTPGANYEFLAETENSFGASAGEVLKFTMNYGKTAQQAVPYLKTAGRSLPEIIGILKAMYSCSLGDCVQILTQNQYTAAEITPALRDSAYRPKYLDLPSLFKKAGITSTDMLQALLKNYRTTTEMYYGRRDDYDIIEILKTGGYSPAEGVLATKSVLGYDVEKTIFYFPRGNLYTLGDIYEAIQEVFSLDALMRQLWAQSVNRLNREIGWGQLYVQLYENLEIMRNIGKLDPLAAGELMKSLYPQLTAPQLADAFGRAKYPAKEAILAVAQMYGTDPFLLAGALNTSIYSKDEAAKVFIEDLGYSAIQMTQIYTEIFTNWINISQFGERILQGYFKLDAVESAKALYAAGWTEKVADKKRYNLGDLIYIMREQYGQKSAEQMIGLLKSLGLSPLEVAIRTQSLTGMLLAYRAQGYSATDAAAFYKVEYASYGLHSQLGVTVSRCDNAGYDLVEIALALRTVYNTDLQTTLNYLIANTKKDTKLINEAVRKAYGEDPILSAIKNMSETPIINIASSLKHTYKITDPEFAVDYLRQANFSTPEIIRGIAYHYYDIRNRDQFLGFLGAMQKFLPEATFADVLTGVIRRYRDGASASYVAYTLRDFGYEMKDIIEILKNDYQVSLTETLTIMLSTFGRAKESAYTPYVMATYGLSVVSFIEYQRNQGRSATQSTEMLVKMLGVDTADKTGEILAQAGYDKQSVSDTILSFYYSGSLTSDAITTINRILEKNFSTNPMDIVRVLLKNGQVKPVSGVIKQLKIAGYGLDRIIEALKTIYILSESQVVEELSRTGLYSNSDIYSTAQSLYGQDFVTLLIRSWQKEPWGNAENIYRKLLRESGITDPGILFKYMRYAGISEYEAVSALDSILFENAVPVLQQLYGEDSIAMLARCWQKKWGNASSTYDNLKRIPGITEQTIFKQMRDAGVSEDLTIKTVSGSLFERIIPVLKDVYGIQNAVDMGKFLSSFRERNILSIYSKNLVDQMLTIYPGTTQFQIVKALQAYGLPVEQNGNDSITGWLRTYTTRGVHDNDLAGYLGPKSGGLNLPPHTAVEILYYKGYNLQDTVYWMIYCGYEWSDFYKNLVHYYAPKNYPTSYYENNSSTKFIVQALKDYYDIKDIARGEFGYWGQTGGVLADLISGGYTLDQAIYATLWLGDRAAADMVVTIVSNSISRANAASDQNLRLNGAQAANKVFDISLAVAYDKKIAGIKNYAPIGLEDLAKSLVRYGPSSSDSHYFSHWEMLEAMEQVTIKFKSLTGVGLPVTEASLAALRMAGASSSDAAEMLASHKVGLSTTSIIKSVFGLGNDWFEAVQILAGAGYSFSDSISAVFNNSSYHTIIGVSVLSTITTSAIGALSASANIGTYISIMKEIAKFGFKIGDGTLSLDDVMKYNPMYLQYKYGKKLIEYVPSN